MLISRLLDFLEFHYRFIGAAVGTYYVLYGPPDPVLEYLGLFCLFVVWADITNEVFGGGARSGV